MKKCIRFTMLEIKRGEMFNERAEWIRFTLLGIRKRRFVEGVNEIFVSEYFKCTF